jgi:hypothetical protein
MLGLPVAVALTHLIPAIGIEQFEKIPDFGRHAVTLPIIQMPMTMQGGFFAPPPLAFSRCAGRV